MKLLSQNALKLQPSVTFTISGKTAEIKRAGGDVVDFSIGEPDFPTPEHIKEAGKTAIAEDFTRYTPIAGIAELRQAIAGKLLRDNGLRYDPAQITVTGGGRQAIANALCAMINPGDEVIIVAPAWVSYKQLILLYGGTPVLVPVERANDYLPTRAAMDAALSLKTKAVIITTPSNPTGRILPEETLRMVADFAAQNDVFIIADEIYEKLVFDDTERHVSIASLDPATFERTVVVNGLSKNYCMTGWRIGYSAAPPQLAKLMTTIQNHTTAHISSISQKAALAALTADQTCVDTMRRAFAERRDYIYNRVCAIDGLYAVKPQGAFYIFIDVSGALGRAYQGRIIQNALDFADILLTEYLVAAVPCEDFGVENHIRLSFATSLETIEKGMDRLSKFMRELA